MLTDEQLDAAREAAKRWMSIDSGIARDLLDEIASLRADLERSQSEHRHTMHVMDGMQDEIVGLRALVDAAEANAKLHFDAAEEMRAVLAAKTLRKETVEIARMAIDTMRQISDTDTDDEDEAMADLDRCYPPEEV